MNDRIANDLIRYAELVEDGALISPEEMNCASLMRIAAEALMSVPDGAQPAVAEQHKQEPVEDLQAKLKWATEQLEANINWEFVAAAKEEMLKAAWSEIKELREQIKEPEQRSVSEHLEPVAYDVRCDNCGGDGYDPKDNNYYCSICEGSRFVEKMLYTTPQPKQEHGKQDNYQGNDAAKAAHMIDLYTALGVRWGDDPFAVIAKMRSIAEAEKQERPTGPATSADRYFYDAGFEAGRLAGIKITLDEWAKSEPPVLAKQEQGEPKQEEYLSKAYRLANELRCHLAIAPAPQQRKPLNAEQIKGLVFDAGYIQAEETADFINGIRHCEAAHGITSATDFKE